MKLIKLLPYFTYLLSFSLTQAQCDSDQSQERWFIDLEKYGSSQLALCGGNYNCHLFALSYFDKPNSSSTKICNDIAYNWSGVTDYLTEYLCPQQWGNLHSPKLDGENTEAIEYKNSGKFVEVCRELDASIAYYEFSGGGRPDHSAVRVDIGGGVIKYFSKYGTDGPLVGHDLRTSYYEVRDPVNIHVTNLEYWAYVGSMFGSSTITSTAKQYSIPGHSGVTYRWTIVSGSENAYISSGKYSRIATVTPTHSGTAVLRLTMSSGCGSTAIQEKTLTIQTGTCLEGSYYINGGPTYNLNTYNAISTGGVRASVSCSYSSTFEWQKTGGNIQYFWPSNNGSYVTFTMPSGGSISFDVKAKIGSSTVDSRSVVFQNYGSYIVYPNPATTTMSIDLAEDLEFTLTLTNLSDIKSKRTIKDHCGKSPIDVSGLQPGRYGLKIYHNQELINQQQIRIKKHE